MHTTAIRPERGFKRLKLVGEFTQTPQLSSGLPPFPIAHSQRLTK